MSILLVAALSAMPAIVVPGPLATGPVPSIGSSAILVDIFVDAASNCATGNGSMTTPFCTIADAVAAANNGDVIRIAPGTYMETVNIAASISLVGTAGPAQTTIDAGGTGTVIVLASSTTVVLEGLTLTGGAGDSGAASGPSTAGAIDSSGALTVRNCVISDNEGVGTNDASAIEHQFGSGPLVIESSRFTNNQSGVNNEGPVLGATGSGPITIRNTTFSSNSSNNVNYGGVLDTAATDVTLESSTIANNVTPDGSTNAFVLGTVNITNSTISDNVGGLTGAINAYNSGLTLSSSTVTGNSNMSFGGAGGIVSYGYNPGETITLTNSIVAGNSSTASEADIRRIGSSAGVISTGFNLIGDRGSLTFAQTDLTGTTAMPLDPLLGDLASNGGPTETQLPLPGSPTIDAGDPANTLPVDQRGFPRTPGLGDIGSTEAGASLGTNYCTANPNTSGNTAQISAEGSLQASDNNFTLSTAGMATFAFGFFITSPTQGFIANPGGSQGNLCLAGSIGRFVGPGQIQNSGAGGEISLTLDLTQQPTPTGFVTVVAGDTWNFTTWFRDTVAGQATSNLSDGLEVMFQ